MFDLNALLQKSWLITGRFDGRKIINNKIQHALLLSAILISSLESVKAFFLVLKPEFRFHLIQLHMTNGEIVQSMFNTGACFIHFSMLIVHVYFYVFCRNSRSITFLSYLFYENAEQLAFEFKIDNATVKRFYKFKKLFWHLASNVSIAFVVLLEALVLRCTVIAIYYRHVTFLEFIFISIPFTLTIVIAYYYSSYTVMTSYITFIANCIFIALRLDDLTRKLKKNYRKQNEKKHELACQMNSILIFYDQNQFLANRTISAFYLTILLIFLFYPFMMIFENNDFLFQLILILGYSQTFIFTSLTIVLSNSLVNRRVCIIGRKWHLNYLF